MHCVINCMFEVMLARSICCVVCQKETCSLTRLPQYIKTFTVVAAVCQKYVVELMISVSARICL